MVLLVRTDDSALVRLHLGKSVERLLASQRGKQRYLLPPQVAAFSDEEEAGVGKSERRLGDLRAFQLLRSDALLEQPTCRSPSRSNWNAAAWASATVS